MTALAVFDYEGHNVRTVEYQGEAWFVATDVCGILGIANSRDAVGRIDRDEVGSADIIDSLSRMQATTIVSEAGLYELIFQSRRPEAVAFRRWVTREVLPAIRKAGSYSNVAKIDRRALAQMVIDAEDRADQAVAALEAAAPQIAVAEQLASAGGDYSLREAAEVLSRDDRIHTGQNLLAKYLHDIGWIDRKGLPYQRLINQGRLAVRSTTYEHPHTGETVLSHQVRVTGKGVAELHRLMTLPPAAGLRSVAS